MIFSLVAFSIGTFNKNVLYFLYDNAALLNRIIGDTGKHDIATFPELITKIILKFIN